MNETLGFTMSTEVDNPPDVLSTNVVSKRQGFISLKEEEGDKRVSVECDFSLFYEKTKPILKDRDCFRFGI